MSGGAFDYNNHWIGSIADTIQNWVDCPDPERHEQRPELVVKLYKEIIPLIKFVDNVIHHIDYYESSDIGEDTLVARTEQSADEFQAACDVVARESKEKSPNE